MNQENEDVKTIKKSGLIYVALILAYFAQIASNSFVAKNNIEQKFFLARLMMIIIIVL